MTFPVVAATNTGTRDSAASTTHTVNLPASISSGDLLVIVCGFGASPAPSASGWTFLATDGTGPYLAFGYKTADGTEGATVTVTTNSAKGSFTSYRITGWSGTPEKGTAATGSSTTPDPPSLSPSWGAADTLWIAACVAANTVAISAAPTNYINFLANTTSNAGGNAATGSATRALNAASEDPGTFTGPSANWVAQTFAIQPAGAAATVKILALLGVG